MPKSPRCRPTRTSCRPPSWTLSRPGSAGGALENDGSVAKVKKQPTIDLSALGWSGQAGGAAAHAGGTAPAAGRVHAAGRRRDGAGRQPLGAAGGGGRAKADLALPLRQRSSCWAFCRFPRAWRTCLKFSRSGSLLLAGGGVGAKSGNVVVFDVKTGKRAFEVGDELDVVLAADINEDHTRIALGGPGPRRAHLLHGRRFAIARDSQAHRMDLRSGVQPRWRLAGHGRSQRRHVRVGSGNRSRVSESGRAQGGDHRRELADRFQRAGQLQAKTAR